MAQSNTKTKPAASKPAAKKSKPAAKPAGRPANVVTIGDLAEQLSTTPKALRARIRGLGSVDRVGKGGTYEFTPAQAKALVKQLANGKGE